MASENVGGVLAYQAAIRMTWVSVLISACVIQVISE
jgi:hypothetical protein